MRRYPQATSGSVALPLELYDEIFSNLSTSDLAACSLIAHRFLGSARRRLFHTLVIQTAHQTRGLDAFLHFLQSDKSASLDNGVQYTRDFELIRSENKNPPFSAFDVGFIVSMLPSLHTLRLSSISIMKCDSFLSHVKSLKLLQLTNVGFIGANRPPMPTMSFQTSESSGCSLVDLLNTFTALDTLQLSDVHFTWEKTDIFMELIHNKFSDTMHRAREFVNSCSTSLRIQNLGSNGSSNVYGTHTAVLEALKELKVLDMLESLEIEDKPTINNHIVRSVSPTLKELRLRVRRSLQRSPTVCGSFTSYLTSTYCHVDVFGS